METLALKINSNDEPEIISQNKKKRFSITPPDYSTNDHGLQSIFGQ